jgi:site-specific recombinase XerD
VILQDAIEEYLLYLHHEQNASPNTSKCYQYALRRFTDWLAQQGLSTPRVHEVSTVLARRYLYHLNDCGLRPRTRLRLWAALRSLFRMLLERGVVTENPLQGIAMPKKDPARRPLVSDEELQEVLAAAGSQRIAWRVARDQAVLAVLIFTGLRRTEVLDLRLQDVDLARNAVYVAHGKGNKARWVPLCSDAKPYLSRWLELRPEAQHDWLWAYGQARRLSANGLAAILEKAKEVAGYRNAENIKPHSIRHRAATRLLQNGADLRSVQAWLGHSHLTTTAVYLHTDEKRLQSIAHLAALAPPSLPTPQTSAPAPAPERGPSPHESHLARQRRRFPARRGTQEAGGAA